MLKRIDRIMLRVVSVPGAVRFYRDVLGMKVLREEQRLASMAFAEGPGELVLHADPDLPAEAVYYLVDDVRAMYAARSESELKFLSAPTAVARGWRAVARDPQGTVLMLIDHTTESAGDGVAEDGKAPSGTLFPGARPPVAPKRELLVKLYAELGRTADDLPYTPHFESLYNAYADAHGEPRPDRGEVWRHLLNLRKAGKLARLGEARSRPPEIDETERQALSTLVVGRIGRRDRLPYTAEFDEIVDRFNAGRTKKHSPHAVWRLVATLAK